MNYAAGMGLKEHNLVVMEGGRAVLEKALLEALFRGEGIETLEALAAPLKSPAPPLKMVRSGQAPAVPSAPAAPRQSDEAPT
ncbi:MAG: hypothetical protein Kow006_31520 [Gammaproteobacteria bacterium]